MEGNKYLYVFLITGGAFSYLFISGKSEELYSLMLLAITVISFALYLQSASKRLASAGGYREVWKRTRRHESPLWYWTMVVFWTCDIGLLLTLIVIFLGPILAAATFDGFAVMMTLVLGGVLYTQYRIFPELFSLSFVGATLAVCAVSFYVNLSDMYQMDSIWTYVLAAFVVIIFTFVSRKSEIPLTIWWTNPAWEPKDK